CPIQFLPQPLDLDAALYQQSQHLTTQPLRVADGRPAGLPPVDGLFAHAKGIGKLLPGEAQGGAATCEKAGGHASMPSSPRTASSSVAAWRMTAASPVSGPVTSASHTNHSTASKRVWTGATA